MRFLADNVHDATGPDQRALAEPGVGQGGRSTPAARASCAAHATSSATWPPPPGYPRWWTPAVRRRARTSPLPPAPSSSAPRVRADPVHAARRARSARLRCCSSRRRSTSTTCSTWRPGAASSSTCSQPGQQVSSSPGATPMPATPTGASTPTSRRCSRRSTPTARSAGRAGRTRRGLLGRDHRAHGGGPPRRHRPPGRARRAHARRHRARPVRRRARRRADGPGLGRPRRSRGRARKGYLDGRALAEVFAWLRPNDLIWNYWVNNYLLGKKPPAFDILYWNADTTRMPADLHRDFVDTRAGQQARQPRSGDRARHAGGPRQVTVDTYVIGGRRRPHHPVAELLPDDPAARRRHRGSCSRPAVTSRPWSTRRPTPSPASRPPRTTRPTNPAGWRPPTPTRAAGGRTTWSGWATARGRASRRPSSLGGGRFEPIAEAPGTYVFDK